MATSKITKPQIIAYAEETYSGTLTIPSSGYLNIAKGTESFRGKPIISCMPTSWGANKGPINVSSETGSYIYLTGNSGDYVTNLKVRFFYLQ